MGDTVSTLQGDRVADLSGVTDPRVTEPPPRVVIAGLRGGSGKTTLSIGLISALKDRGISVIPFKKGPDYIDSGWLASAAKGPCYNLDPFLIGEDRVVASFIERSADRGPETLAVIEGNRGLYDGMDSEGTFSTARLANILMAPVLLIIDCTKMTRTTAAVVLGVEKFDPNLKLKGIILNQIAGIRHEAVIRESLKKYCGVPVLGAIPRLSLSVLPERHMGLTPYQEHPGVAEAIAKTGELIERYVDVDGVIRLAKSAGPLKPAKLPEVIRSSRPFTIGVIRDSAFQFYYPENFEELQKKGVRLIEVSAITDKRLPPMDGLYIGGGFPETHAIALAKNKGFKKDLLRAAEDGLPVYAECGGLMYLGESLKVNAKTYPMAGVLPISFLLQDKPEAHGYTVVEARRSSPFYRKGIVLRGHEFHYSRVTDIKTKKGLYFAFKMLRGKGIKDRMDGLCYKNVFATYTHLHALGSPEWVEGIVSAACRWQNQIIRQAVNKPSTQKAGRVFRMS